MPEIFSKRIDLSIENLHGVVKSMHDVLVYGRTVAEHDENLYELFKVIVENGMTLNQDKCFFSENEVEFLGYVVSSEGIRPFY